MAGDDPRQQAEAESSALRRQIGAAVAMPDGSDVTARALANALVAVVQEYLERTSGPEDVELFFEVHGRTPTQVTSWPAGILADLHRHGISAQDRSVIRDRAAVRAIEYIASRSPLAWGEEG
ncbi:MAG TPA: hypothetical protein VGZ32_19185 [Actinocrinis sp.]|jgi:hypothetical protein|uniref:hypothetical protein n=1 Tax=Actinocrinis sp. TaxID=1920516 RepID=UPI002DDD3174|nr:hypothetical protein [Actinocrinis sp.]HEV3172478.1 hypothetical protein [Actinocrinis sp.]